MPYAVHDGARLYYEVHGDADKEPLLFLGGWGRYTGSTFEKIEADIRARFRIVVYDHRGLGDSDSSPGDGSTADYADDAAAVLADAGIDRAHVIGHGGLGAGVAQRLAIQHPDRVASMVLVSGWAGPEPYHDAQIQALITARRDSGFAAFRLLAVLFGYLPEYVNDNPEAFDRGWDGPGNVGEREDAHLKLMVANLTHDARAGLAAVNVPALVLCGSEEQLGSPRLSRELAELISGSELVVMPGLPHVFRSVPGGIETYTSAVLAFLDAHSGATKNVERTSAR